MNKISSFWLWVARHKYSATIVMFALLIGALDDNSLYHRIKNQAQLTALKSEIRSYKARYDNDSEQLEQLKSNIEAVRRVARERYYMKKECEDVFVFVPDTTAYAGTI